MPVLDLDELIDKIASIRYKRALITGHRMADTDIVASSIILSKYIINRSDILFDGGLTASASRLYNLFNYDKGFITMKDLNDERLSSYYSLIFLDTNEISEHYDLVKEFPEERIFVIDHHYIDLSSYRYNVNIFNDERYSSTSSVVYAIAKSLDIKLSQNDAKLLAYSIYEDSAGFRNSSYITFMQFGELLKIARCSYNEIEDLIKHESQPDTNIHIIDSITRAQHLILKDKLILMIGEALYVGANTCAERALNLGVDIALFYSVRDEDLSFSARANPILESRYGINLGYIFNSIAIKLNASGGGHPSAAGAYGVAHKDRSYFIERFVKYISDMVD
ncbi:MAG: manganese-dependent inorganic pyrophosphatase [Candidatus Micrarchaeota archaeon]|nr:MAG: manganese-dependent inorganic pyrophosphatase [Candidatus Micrarchaeota archaeon]